MRRQGGTPEAGVLDVVAYDPATGKVTVTDEAGDVSTFNGAGVLESMASPLDDRGQKAAAITTDDSAGRPQTVADPVSGRQFVLRCGGELVCAGTIPPGMLCQVAFKASAGATARCGRPVLRRRGRLVTVENLGMERTDFAYQAAAS